MGLDSLIKSIVSDGAAFLKKRFPIKKENKKMPERPPSTIPAGTWGGDFDPIIKQRRAQQLQAIDANHQAMLVARQKAEAAQIEELKKSNAEALKKLEDQQIELQKQQDIAAQLNSQQTKIADPNEVYQEQKPVSNLNHHDIKIGRMRTGKEPVKAEFENKMEREPVLGPADPGGPKDPRKIFRKRDSNFVAGQSILSFNQLQVFVDNDELNTDVMLEISKCISELQYSITTALLNKLC